MNDHALWSLTIEALTAIRAHYWPVAERIAAESGLDGWMWGLLLAAFTFEPETTTPALLQVRGPYTATEGYLTRLAAAAEKDYLVEVALGEYHLTDTGRAEVHRSVEEVRAAMVEADPLPEAESERLIDLLDRLVQACLDTPPPPDTLRRRSGQA